MPINENINFCMIVETDPVTGRPNREPIPLEVRNSGLKKDQPFPRQWNNHILFELGEACRTIESEYTEADGVLQDSINSEATARINQDNSLQGQIDSLLEALNSLTDKVIPKVGDTWITKSTQTPLARFGVGTWSLIEGKMLVGVDSSDPDFNNIGEEGGGKTHSHTATSGTTTTTTINDHALTVDEIPSHVHRLYGTDTSSSSVEALNGALVAGDTNGNGAYTNLGELGNQLVEDTGGGQGHNHTASSSSTTTTTLNTGSSLSPYHVVYIWERTA